MDAALAEARNELGVAYTEEQRYSEAEAELKSAIEASPAAASPRNNLGVLYVRLGRHVEAEALFRRAVEDAPSVASFRVNWGLTLASLGRLHEARTALLQAKNLDSEDPKADRALSMIEDQLRGARETHSGRRQPVP